MTTATHSLALRLAGPLQSWGSRSQFNRRDTDSEPTKSALIGLLAAADGRRRGEPIEDLLDLRFGIRTDQPGSLLRDYHTVSDFRGGGLRTSSTLASGQQRRDSRKPTAVTERFYLQDAIFTAVIQGHGAVLEGLAAAIQRPGFPLSLGRRACVPTLPIVIRHRGSILWNGDIASVTQEIPWQAGTAARERHRRAVADPSHIMLAVTLDDDGGVDHRTDVPVSFAPRERGFRSRTVTKDWVSVPTGLTPLEHGGPDGAHDPFILLGW